MQQLYARQRAAVHDGHFPDPFNDVASMHMPTAKNSVLLWAEFIFMQNGMFRQAMERVISYFLTDLDFGTNAQDTDQTDDDETSKWYDFMTDTLDWHTVIQNGLRDRSCYGNHFASLIRPFKRFLVCPGRAANGGQCAAQTPLEIVYKTPVYGFSFVDCTFHAKCPHCGHSGAFLVRDLPVNDEQRISIKRWNPHEIEILHDPYTEEVAYLWRIPEDYRQQVLKGNLFHLERVPMEVMSAIKKKQMFRFDPDVIFHMKEPCPSGIRNRGWGIPRSLTNFRQMFHVQVLRRANEAIALDYIIPFRVITPAPRGGAGGAGAASPDPLMGFNGSDSSSAIRRMIAMRAKNPLMWHTLPFPVQYQMMGGEASKLVPMDMINQAEERLLNDVGVPVELYKGTLQMATAIPALRVFEAQWHHLVHDANAMLRWIVRQISQVMSWEIVNVKLQSVTIADDMNVQMQKLQLMAGQQISGTSAFRGLGLDYKAEQRRIGEETLFQADQQAKIQERMDQAGFAQQLAKAQAQGGGAPGGAPAGGGQAPAGGDPSQQGGMPAPVSQWIASMGPDTPIQPQELVQAADMLAQSLLGLPDQQKNSEMRALKQKNVAVWSLVTKRIEEIRRDARNTGGNQVMQQTFGGGGQPQQQAA